MKFKPYLLFALALLPLSPSAHADGKDQYHLFNPVPEEKLRPFKADRPDQTETPLTVDAGHFQVETALVSYARRQASAEGHGQTQEVWNLNNMYLKVGVTNHIDAQVHVASYVRENAGGERASGFGDLSLRVKANFLGNDGGPFAFGILPYLRLPTGAEGITTGKVEGGIIFPVALRLAPRWMLDAEWEFAREKNEIGDGYHGEYTSSLSLAHEFTERFGAFVEFYSEASLEPGVGWKATFDTGVEWKVQENVQLDAGVNIGLTEAADDLNPFVGLAFRI